MTLAQVKSRNFIVYVAICLIILTVASFFIGRTSLFGTDNASVIITKIRFPRIVGAILVGGGLGISGASYQGIMQNPLVSPFILGVSAGAGFGSALGILLGASPFITQALAFIFGNLAVWFAISVVGNKKNSDGISLVLAGMIVGSLFSALLSLIKIIADPSNKLPSIVFWLLGSLSEISTDNILWAAFPLCFGSFFLYVASWKLNILGMGDDEARRLGENPVLLKTLFIIASTMVASAAISMAGIIGWIGLVIPHIGRMLLGADFRKLIPFSFLGGAFYLLLVDDFCRSAASIEIPIGILTSLVGAPVFAWLLKTHKIGWS